MTTAADTAYKHALRGKPYMMGISPYFYTSTFRPLPFFAHPPSEH
jgi:hypothetical protein